MVIHLAGLSERGVNFKVSYQETKSWIRALLPRESALFPQASVFYPIGGFQFLEVV